MNAHDSRTLLPGSEFNAKTQRRKDAKIRNFLVSCAFAPLRLCAFAFISGSRARTPQLAVLRGPAVLAPGLGAGADLEAALGAALAAGFATLAAPSFLMAGAALTGAGAALMSAG